MTQAEYNAVSAYRAAVNAQQAAEDALIALGYNTADKRNDLMIRFVNGEKIT